MLSRCAVHRWGNKLSNKLFMGKEFVLKHIRLKHAARVETELARVRQQCCLGMFCVC